MHLLGTLIFTLLSIYFLGYAILHIIWPPWLRERQGRRGWGSPERADRLRWNSTIVLFACALGAALLAINH